MTVTMETLKGLLYFHRNKQFNLYLILSIDGYFKYLPRNSFSSIHCTRSARKKNLQDTRSFREVFNNINGIGPTDMILKEVYSVSNTIIFCYGL